MITELSSNLSSMRRARTSKAPVLRRGPRNFGDRHRNARLANAVVGSCEGNSVVLRNNPPRDILPRLVGLRAGAQHHHVASCPTIDMIKALRHLLAVTSVPLLDLIRLLILSFRSAVALRAENLFLHRQLAL